MKVKSIRWLVVILLAFIGCTYFAFRTSFFSTSSENDEIRFITEMIDARLMDSAEGELAVNRATKNEIKSYGRWMIEDQAILLEELKKLAVAKNISVPAEISKEKADGLAELKKRARKALR